MLEAWGEAVGVASAVIYASCWMGLIIRLSFQQWKNASERSGQLLQRWVSKRNFTIINDSMINPLFNDFLQRSNAQRVFEVAIRDADSRMMRGDVKCGHFLLGSLVGRIEARSKDGSERQPDNEIVPPDR